MKFCKFCGLDKEESKFPINKDSRDGRHSKCRQCCHEYYKNWIKRPEVRIKKRLEWDKPYQERKVLEPEKTKARDLLRSAVRLGNIVKPEKCSICDNKKGRIEGHHEDYSKPFEVVWCCTSCHGKIHRTNKY